MTGRIYLDNAATSWPKSQSVIQAVTEFITECGATAGRGSYRSALEADRWLTEARLQIARLIGARESNSIAFCSSGTHALNAALLGLVRPGDHVITTEIEHNSVLRPLTQLARQRSIELDYARSDFSGVACLKHAENLIRPETKWFIISHASNVTGTIQDLNAWSRLAHHYGASLIVDASQTIGYVPLHVIESGISVLASAGHKGLGGIAGTGFLYSTKDLQAQFQPLMTGGTGLNSESMESPNTWPQVIEVGNHNLPGIVSMAVAAKELNRMTEKENPAWQTNWRKLYQALLNGLHTIPSVTTWGFSHVAKDTIASPFAAHDGSTTAAVPTLSVEQTVAHSTVDRVPLVSLQVEGWDVHELASILDSSFGIEARAGLHCAAKIHSAIGSQNTGGTLRLSLGHASSMRDVQAALEALATITNS